MQSKTIKSDHSPAAGKPTKVRSSQGGLFDCYLAVPQSQRKTAAVVIASAVYGVDADIRALADEFAERGFIAAAPDLFWRSTPGPLPAGDERTRTRSEPRLDRIKAGETDMTDVLAHLKSVARFNERAAVIGLCYGGPYAILGPKRLGYTAGISCHGSQMLDYLGELEGMVQPVCIIWGDRDHRAPSEVLDAYRAAARRLPYLDLHIFPGVQHSYMMRGLPDAFDQKVRDFSMDRACTILDRLRS